MKSSRAVYVGDAGDESEFFSGAVGGMEPDTTQERGLQAASAPGRTRLEKLPTRVDLREVKRRKRRAPKLVRRGAISDPGLRWIFSWTLGGVFADSQRRARYDFILFSGFCFRSHRESGGVEHSTGVAAFRRDATE